MTARAPIDTVWFRQVVAEVTGTDPGALDAAERLDAIGLEGVDRLLVLTHVEALLGVEFPHDLEPALATVADLLYYARIKVEQTNSDGARR